MKRSTALQVLSIGALAASAAAQAPLYIDLSPGSRATDVTVTATDIVVVGTDSTGGAFRWNYSTNFETGLLAGTSTNGTVKVSTDGTKACCTTPDGLGNTHASRYDGVTWTTGPSLGSMSGTSVSTAYGISGDGQTVVGLGWISAGSAHCYSWNQTTGVHDYGGLFSDPSSRANCVNGDGSVIAGWKDLLNGTRQGARWINGVMQPQLTWTDPSTMIPYKLGEAYGTNANGSTIVGYRIFSAPTGYGTHAWRFDSGTGLATTLANLAGETTSAQANDVSNDGTRIVGHSGGNIFTGTAAILWINNTPNRLRDYLIGLGTVGVGAYPEIGIATAISGDGYAICGYGTGIGLGQPGGGWVVIWPDALQVGTAYCFGDGSGAGCPCANTGALGRGCANSVDANGSRLGATGFASIGADAVVLHGSGMPNSSALYFQGTLQQSGGLGTPFGDGLRCAAGSVVRLGTKTNAAGVSQYPAPGDPSVSVKGLVTTPGTRTYQVWYRNAAAFCTASTFNLSNGMELLWSL